MKKPKSKSRDKIYGNTGSETTTSKQVKLLQKKCWKTIQNYKLTIFTEL